MKETRVTDLLEGQVPEGESQITFEREDWFGKKKSLGQKVTQVGEKCYVIDKKCMGLHLLYMGPCHFSF